MALGARDVTSLGDASVVAKTTLSGTEKHPLFDGSLPLKSMTSADLARAMAGLGFTVSVANVTGDGVADDTAAIQSAMDAAYTAGGGMAYIARPDTACKAASSLVWRPNVILAGVHKYATTITVPHTGDGLACASAINSSTAVRTGLRDIGITCTNASNTGGGIVDVGGTFGEISNVRVEGFKYGAILDQSELFDIDLCDFEAQLRGGIWLTNGNDHSPGASAAYTNRISVKRTQINQNSTVYGVIDDGGTAHAFEDINYNGCLNHLRAAGVTGLSIRGGEWESAAGVCAYFTNTTLEGGDGTGQNIVVEICGGATFVPTAGQSCLSFDNSTPVVISSVYLGNTTATKIIGGSNIHTLWLGPVSNAGGGATLSGTPTVLYAFDDVTGIFSANKIKASAMPASSSYANDAAAAVGGVGVGEFYRNGSSVQCRIA